MSTNPGMLSQFELERLVADGEIDTVIVAFCDMQGRLTGKRVSGRLFTEDVAAHGAECCNYLLAVDVEMNTVDGYAMSSWDTGYGDMVMKPDFSTLRRIPWLPGTALVIADLFWDDGSPVTAAPRSILNKQIERLSQRGLVPYVGTELEFMVFDDSYREAWAKGYHDLTPATDYNVDYAMAGSTRGRLDPD
jgi:glutamine synthetase